LIKNHKDYARFCDADYHVFEEDLDYTELMFFKIKKAEELTEIYDAVLYLDVDVIPKTILSFFDAHDLDKVCLHQTLKPNWKINLKQMMLIDDNIRGNEYICNTGVFSLNKKSSDLLKFSDRLEEAMKLHSEIDNNDLYMPNNEVYISYMIEKYGVPLKDIGMPWNFILDKNFTTSTDACYFLHQSNKLFK
tara:strand:+ start:114 stop:686 length:573 start_codon:yes stop_codon:yes gene_type:complete